MPQSIYRPYDDVTIGAPPPASVMGSTRVVVGAKKRKRTSPSRRNDSTGASCSPDAKPNHTAQATEPRSARFWTLGSQHTNLKERAAALALERKKLPIWSHASEIRSGLRNYDVTLIVGETGSGKSTQVPQMLIEEDWCISQQIECPSQEGRASASDTSNHQRPNASKVKKVKVGGCIAITEPRKVAAVSLAERVAREMGTPLGSSSPASTVGFSVRFHSSTSPSTRVKYLTEGTLLQEMLRDPWLRNYSAVVLDEVHERGVNVDLLLGFLRQIVSGNYEGRGGIPLKVIIMSATIEMRTLEAFFEAGFKRQSVSHATAVGQTPAMKYGVPDEESEWSGLSSDDEDYMPESQKMKQISPLQHISSCYVEGRQFPVTIDYEAKPVSNWLDAMLRTIFQVHYKEPLPGDILVFLTGQETVESLQKLIKEHESEMRADVPKLQVLPLFAALPQDAQQAVFQSPPPKTRKVILATNIAETSVTVPGVRFVIDCGKAKIKHFRTGLGLESLLVKPISKSAAVQRMGRAGREAPGKCWRLYTEEDYLSLPQSNTPEILRCDLSQAILTMQARGIYDFYRFPFLDRPRREAYEKALMHLFQLGALDEAGHINDIGIQMATLPLSGSLARTLLAATEPELDCVSEVVDIIACLSVENVFLKTNSEESKEQAEQARRAMYRREGDHLTLLATIQAYAVENADRKAWCNRHLVSHRAMKAVMDVRKQLRSLPPFTKFLSTDVATRSILTSELSTSILKCFVKGFAYNTALRLPDGSYKTVAGHQKVAIHPSSVLFGKSARAILFNEFVFTNKSYARGVSAVEMSWLETAWQEPTLETV